MYYMKVAWIHDFEDDPVEIYSENDDRRWEVRKVEIYRNGKMGYASKKCAKHGSRLSIEPIPDIDEIGLDPQFEPKQISKENFEHIWQSAKHND